MKNFSQSSKLRSHENRILFGKKNQLIKKIEQIKNRQINNQKLNLKNFQQEYKLMHKSNFNLDFRSLKTHKVQKNATDRKMRHQLKKLKNNTRKLDNKLKSMTRKNQLNFGFLNFLGARAKAHKPATQRKKELDSEKQFNQQNTKPKNWKKQKHTIFFNSIQNLNLKKARNLNKAGNLGQKKQRIGKTNNFYNTLSNQKILVKQNFVDNKKTSIDKIVKNGTLKRDPRDNLKRKFANRPNYTNQSQKRTNQFR